MSSVSTSGVATAVSLGIPEMFNAATYFVDRNVDEGFGSKIAIECADERVSYRDLLERVNRFGSALQRRLDVRPEERVLLILFDRPEFAYSFFGAIKIGAVPIPVNTQWKPGDYQYVLNDSRARVAVVSESLLGAIERIPRAVLPHLRHVIVAGSPRGGARSLDDVLAEGSPELEPAPTSRDDGAFWLYSSGTTGPPKACVHLHHDMVVCAELYGKRTLGISSSDRFFSVAKLFFAYGLGNALYFPLSVGATSILWPEAPTPPNVFSVVERHRPTLLFSVPTSYAMLLAHRRESGGDVDLSSVRCAVSAGEALPPALFQRFKERFGIEILDGIGSTELLHIFISNRAGEVRPGSSGRVVPGYACRIVDDDGRIVSVEEIGNLMVCGDSTCSSYWNRHEKSRETFEGPWCRTGDKYRQDPDGYFWYAGRSDDMLKVGGIWVSPVEVENALLEHQAVQECAVIGHPDHDSLIKPLAYVVLKPSLTGTPELGRELQRLVASKLADFKRPRWIEFLPELPKTATGKVQRFKLRAR